MHRIVAGTCQLNVRLQPRGPWMVRGHPDSEPFVDHRGQQNRREVLKPLLDGAGRPWLPASSLKGVLRSTAERILRSMHPDRHPDLIPLADNPFVRSVVLASDEASNGGSRRSALPSERSKIADSELLEWIEQRRQVPGWLDAHSAYKPLARDRPDMRALYPLLSPASQLFGCTLHAGLLTLEDAHAEASTLQRRSHVAIDRFSHGVGAGPFLEDLAQAGAPLVTQLAISNFALWQMALLAFTLQELERGYAGVGGGTRKGQGSVSITVTQIDLRYAAGLYGNRTGVVSAQQLLGMLLPQEVPQEVMRSEREPLLPALRPAPGDDWREAGLVSLTLTGATITQLFQEAARNAWQPWLRLMRGEEVT